MLHDIDLFHASPREILAELVDLEPSPTVMTVLLAIDRAGLSPDDAITYLQIHERVSSWWASLQTSVLIAAARPEPYLEEYRVLVPDSDEERTIRIQDAVREEAACALRLTPTSAQERIDTARLLTDALAATQESLAMGEITLAHVRAIVDAAERLSGAQADPHTDPEGRRTFLAACERLQERVLPVARRTTVGRTRRAADRAVLVIDAEGARRRRERARCTRDVFVIDEADGLSLFMTRMATPLAHAALAMVQGVADEADPDGRTAGERRVDALAEIVLGDPGRAPSTGDAASAAVAGVNARVDVVVPLTTLLGLSEEPGYLNGRTPLSGDEVRDLLSDPDVRVLLHRLVTDPLDGAPLDYGRRTYEVPRRLRRVIEVRDRLCRLPGCNRPARRCQMDHARSWDDNGPTSPENVGPLCIRHHIQKTFGGWDLLMSLASGACRWRSPMGRIYDCPADELLVAESLPPPF